MVASAFLLYFACVCGSRSAVAIGETCLRSQRFQCARAFCLPLCCLCDMIRCFFEGVGENRSPYGLSCLRSSLTCGIKRDTYGCFQGAQNRANVNSTKSGKFS